ncbi:MAG: gap junction protein [Candidatus Omnitrophica bacterium]|nr:gap junction protein [Candidatus Omnitrophota bacterium]
MARNKRKKEKSGKKRWVLLVIFVLLAGGAYIGYTKYIARQKQLAEQKAKEEELKKQQLAQEQKRKELQLAVQMFAELIARMKEALMKGNYKLLKELAGKAREIAIKYNFSVDEIDRILRDMNLRVATGKLKELERITDPYAHMYVRNQLKKIPKYPEIAQRWNNLWNRTFQDEYTVVLDLAEITVKKIENGENPEMNYTLSKSYLKKAKTLVALGKAKQDTFRETSLLDQQSLSYIANIGKSFQPASLYR